MKRILDVLDRAKRQIGREVGYVPQQIACGWARGNAQDILQLIEVPVLFESAATPLSELLLNTCCIADQYHVNVIRGYRQAKLPSVLSSAMLSCGSHAELKETAATLVKETNQLTSILAFYHGWNWAAPRVTLRQQITEVHRHLYSLAHLLQIDLVKGTSDVIENARGRTQSGLTDRYDPVTSLVLREFAPIKENSVCTFAPDARMWGARPWDSKKSLEANLNDSLETLARLSRCAKTEDVDAFLIMLPGSYGSSVNELAKTVDRVLRFFAHHDPSGENCLDQINQNVWRYRFLRVPYFVQSFAPCYGSNNTRYAENINATFINFVTEYSFHRLIPRDQYASARQKIRDKADSQGRPYDIQPHESDFFVHNDRAGLQPVKWSGTSVQPPETDV
jgi:hypothetical protein